MTTANATTNGQGAYISLADSLQTTNSHYDDKVERVFGKTINYRPTTMGKISHRGGFDLLAMRLQREHAFTLHSPIEIACKGRRFYIREPWRYQTGSDHARKRRTWALDGSSIFESIEKEGYVNPKTIDKK